MRLWRVSEFADMEGAGGLLYPARWHNVGRPIVYAAQSPAGALLEVIAHLNRRNLPESLQFLEIDIGDEATVEAIEPPRNWRDDIAGARGLGDAWLSSGRSLVLRVPSVLAPRTWNFLLNPKHPDAAAMRIVSTTRFPFDARLN